MNLVGRTVRMTYAVRQGNGEPALASSVQLQVRLPGGGLTTLASTSPAPGDWEGTYTPVIHGEHLVIWLAAFSDGTADVALDAFVVSPLYLS